MSDAGLAAVDILLPLTIALELGGGLALIFGSRTARWVAGCALAVFTLATNAVFHRFWALRGPIGELELALFFKNVAIAGALLVVAAGGSPVLKR